MDGVACCGQSILLEESDLQVKVNCVCGVDVCMGLRARRLSLFCLVGVVGASWSWSWSWWALAIACEMMPFSDDGVGVACSVGGL